MDKQKIYYSEFIGCLIIVKHDFSQDLFNVILDGYSLRFLEYTDIKNFLNDNEFVVIGEV